MIKVIHIIHGLNTGGAETLVKEYALSIDKSKFIFKIICFDRLDSPYDKLLKDNNISVLYLSDFININRSNYFFKLVYKIKLCYLLKKILQKEKPNILHTHLNINNYIKVIRPSKNIKIYHTIHSETSIVWKKGDLRKKIDFLAAKWLVKNYNMRFIVLHNKMKEEIDLLFNVNNSIVLNNGIDFSRFSIFKDKNMIRKKLKIPNDSFVIGHIGRFIDSKNHLFLIDIFNELYKINKNVFLLMIGSGPNRKNVEDKLKSLNLNNYLILENRTDIPDLLNSMNCFVFPSFYEGLGIVLIEAQKMKLPCFKSDKVPNYSIISNLVSSLSLEDSPSIWAKEIINFKYPKKVILDDKDWDIKEVMKKLESIYRGEL